MMFIATSVWHIGLVVGLLVIALLIRVAYVKRL
jgi:hypothetical protein